MSNVIDQLTRLSSEIGREELYQWGGRMQEVFVRTLIVDKFAEHYYPHNPVHPFVETISEEFGTYMSTHKQGVSETKPRSYNLEAYFRNCRVTLAGTSLYRSKAGNLGLCPVYTQIGDILVLLVGCQTPLILRPQVGNTFLVVGEAYCHGFMNGESFLGPLPTGVQVVTKLDKSESPLFINRKTGEMQGGDPRLEEVLLKG